MASSSSPCTWRYRVFTSFHGPDVRKTFLSHLRKQFNYNGITMFDDNGIERSQTIASSLTQAIRESRIAVVLLSKKYASSSWCLDELLEILKCKEVRGQKVMTVFYGVDPSEVRNQTGDFGKAFNKTCSRKTDEDRRKWSQALTYVGNIAGEHFQNWNNEAEMIEKITSDVSDKLNATPCRDFDGMVGLEGHLINIESLLDLDNDRVKVVGICGPAGIGKSTIARALHSRLDNKFQLNYFVDNLREIYKVGSGEYRLKLSLQEELLKKMLNQPAMRIGHLGVIQERLNDQKVLITLDDVESLDQLEALANFMWFGAGSRVIVTTENKEILQQHGINDIYHVGFPSEGEARMIFCQSAFRQTSPPAGFMSLAYEVAKICGNLPLGLHVLGSLLRGKSQADWIDELPRLKSYLDGRIESVLKVGYESLHEKDQVLFLHIAVFFNHAHVDRVTSMLAKTNLDVRLGLKILANKYLIHIDHVHGSEVVMHSLLQVMARQVISRQETWKRQILVDSQEICYVLEKAAGHGSIVGVSFDVAEINELTISARAFERMCNLLLLKVYNGRHTGMGKLHIPEELEFPCRVSLLHWDAYPRKSLPLRFCAENLVELYMPDSKLEKLWEGTQPLTYLKKMDLCGSSRLKELPDLSNATNLEILMLSQCIALVELPSSIAKLHKIVWLDIRSCKSLEVIPSLVTLTSLESIYMYGLSQLRINLPDMPSNIHELNVELSMVEELPASLRHCSRLEYVYLARCGNLKTFSTHLPTSIKYLSIRESGIERITTCIKGLHNLEHLHLSRCKRLAALPELPGSLKLLLADNCESLEKVSGPLNTPNAIVNFTNCINLNRQARQAIIRGSLLRGWALLPGSEVPAGFHHRARGNSLTIPHSTFNRFKVCVVIKPNHNNPSMKSVLSYRCKVNHRSVNSAGRYFGLLNVSIFRTKHLFIFNSSLPLRDPSAVSRKIVLKFSRDDNDHSDIIECGIQILMDETDRSNTGDEDEDNDQWVDDDSIASGISESGEASDKEDDESESESGEALKDDGISDDEEEDDNGDDNDQWVKDESDKASVKEEDDDDGIASGRSESESGEASDKEEDESDSGEASEEKDEGIGDDGDYESVSMKHPWKTTITSATTMIVLALLIMICCEILETVVWTRE